MAYPTAAGVRNIAATTMRYVPQLWSSKLLIKFYATTVFGEIANTDYEGEIKQQGDSVYIRAIPSITIRDHQKGQTITHEQPSATPTQLDIDQGKYWAFSTNRVDDAQTDIKNYADIWTSAASRDLAVAIDTAILAGVYSSAATANQGATAGAISGNINLGVDGGTSVQLTRANILDKIVECGQVLDEQNATKENRWIVLPVWACTLLKLSDLKAAYLTGDSVSPIRNGRVGKINDMMVYESNLLATTTDGAGASAFCCIAGTMDAITFASQLVENEDMPNPNAFGHLYRGLQVYGYKVVKPEALVWLYAKQG